MHQLDLILCDQMLQLLEAEAREISTNCPWVPLHQRLDAQQHSCLRHLIPLLLAEALEILADLFLT